ncbi:hypothetical protein [Enterobacter hormaechei]|uniref:hypothetical protein n=1 Tax=Enterobacter hormaechei TaxID=158836 RepID=UPI00388E4B8D
MAERVSRGYVTKQGLQDELDKTGAEQALFGLSSGFGISSGPAASHNKHINVFIASIQYYCVKGIPSKSAYACLKTKLPRLQSFIWLLWALYCV